MESLLRSSLTADEQKWMDLARAAALNSPDRSRKTGAVIVTKGGFISACNTFPEGIEETDERHQRPAKYDWIEHAERKAIYAAAAEGRATAGATMVIPWYPCVQCARAVIDSRFCELIAVEPDWQDPHYANDFRVVREMLDESQVRVRLVDGQAPVRQPDSALLEP